MNNISKFAKYLIRHMGKCGCLCCENEREAIRGYCDEVDPNCTKAALIYRRLRQLGISADKMMYCARVRKDEKTGKNELKFRTCCNARRFLGELCLITGGKISGLCKEDRDEISRNMTNIAVRIIQEHVGVPSTMYKKL